MRNRLLILAWMITRTAGYAMEPCRIAIVEKTSGWPVPMVELRTTHNVRFVSDNAGVIAFDLPELMGQETWVSISGHGYEVKADGFGYRGLRITPKPGGDISIPVERKSIAKRLGRLTGGGIFAESQKAGNELSWRESGILGSDSIQNAVHQGRLFWAWGDTTMADYPLGIFHMTSATSSIRPLASFVPPVRLELDYFSDAAERVRAVAEMPGSGPTWLSGYVSLPDATGTDRLVAAYAKIKPPLEAYEAGLCVWNDSMERFDRLSVLWTKSSAAPTQPLVPEGHPSFWKDVDGKQWVLFGNPLPKMRCPANFEAWRNPATWEELKPQETLESGTDGKPVKPHSGSIAWNGFRKRWVTVFMETFGKPSAFGELWYAESDAPTGPWGGAVKILSHDNYTFYNPRLHPEFTPADSPLLLFEGTYTILFVPQRFDRIQIRGYVRGIGSKDDSHGRANQKSVKYPVVGNHWGNFEEKRRCIAPNDTQGNAENSANLAKHNRLQDELRHDVSFLCADGPADPDFACSLCDRDQHDVHDPNSRGNQSDRTDNGDPCANDAGKRIELADKRVIREDFEIVLISWRNFPHHPKNPAHLFKCVVVGLGVPNLHVDRKTPPDSSVSIQPRCEGNHREVVLVSSQHRAAGRKDANHGIIDAVKLNSIANSGTEWKESLCERRSEHADVARIFHVRLHQGAPFFDHPVSSWKTAGGLAQEPDCRRRFIVS